MHADSPYTYSSSWYYMGININYLMNNYNFLHFFPQTWEVFAPGLWFQLGVYVWYYAENSHTLICIAHHSSFSGWGLSLQLVPTFSFLNWRCHRSYLPLISLPLLGHKTVFFKCTWEVLVWEKKSTGQTVIWVLFASGGLWKALWQLNLSKNG